MIYKATKAHNVSFYKGVAYWKFSANTLCVPLQKVFVWGACLLFEIAYIGTSLGFFLEGCREQMWITFFTC